MNNLEVGHIIEVSGNNVVVEMFDKSNPPFYYVNGTFYHGVSVGSFLGVLSGPYKIILRINKEYIEDINLSNREDEYSHNGFVRKVVATVIGWFLDQNIYYGLNKFPFIYNKACLLTGKEIETIQSGLIIEDEWKLIKLGESIETRTPVNVDWSQLFNTHIGIFGNTGSGKSNTLAAIYTKLFENKDLYLDPSRFLFIDFSGEYSDPASLVFTENKKVLRISTKKGGDKINITPEIFWNTETLSILFSATEKTQRPFLSSVIKNYFRVPEDYKDASKILDWIIEAFKTLFKANNNKELMHIFCQTIEAATQKSLDIIKLPLFVTNYHWHSKLSTFYHDDNSINIKGVWWNNLQGVTLADLCAELRAALKDQIPPDLTETDRLLIASNLEFINLISKNDAQFDHINPVINRIIYRKSMIDNIYNITEAPLFEKNITVFCLKDCNIDAKKFIPLLTAIQCYKTHKDSLIPFNKKTFHLVIDEAQNILSDQSNRETETWKDYRLEVFEEIIKEGRKFGFFLTISSQRPADISATIVSQIHNYFVHRLVNEKDLYMMTSTISNLDTITKQKLPSLGPGQCIMLGTSFKFPILVQVEKLDDAHSPKSETVDLEKIWYYGDIPF